MNVIILLDLKTRCAYIFFFIAMAIASGAGAQSLLKSIPLSGPNLMTTDNSGNVYVVYKSNNLIRYNADGDSSASYNSISNGVIGGVDATNPLKVLLYYPDYSKIEWLDKQLSLKSELDLKTSHIYNATAVCVSTEGMLWVYDPLNAVLKKIDDQQNIITASNDLRSETGEVPQPAMLLERDYKIYLADTAHGIYTFDRFGTYINTLPFYNITKMQVVGSQLIYRHTDSLMVYDLRANTQKAVILKDAGHLLDARVERNRLYILYDDRLEIYKTEG